MAATGCLAPPSAPAASFLTSDWIGPVLPFGAAVNFSCAPSLTKDAAGQVTGSTPRFFSTDQSKNSVSLTCQLDGTYLQPSPWPTCVVCKWSGDVVVVTAVVSVVAVAAAAVAVVVVVTAVVECKYVDTNKPAS